MAMTASASAALVLLQLLFLLEAATASESSQEASACTASRVLCQLRPGAAPTIDCSAVASAAAAAAAWPSSQVVSFNQTQPESLSLWLPASHGGSSSSYSLTNLQAVVTCFMLTYQAKLRLVAGQTEFRLMPGCLDALTETRRLTLRLRFAEDRIPGRAVFTARLGARLQNLQLESPGVSAIEPGAFQELRSLTRLYISNLKLSHLTSDTLQGLSNLHSLELPVNSLARLDAASFAATPRLESIDLRTSLAPDQVTVAPNTFCSLPALQLMQYSPSLRVNCSHFASRQINLALSDGADSQTVNCVRLLGEKTPCSAASPVTMATATPTKKTTTTSTITEQTKPISTAKPNTEGTSARKLPASSTSSLTPTSTASSTTAFSATSPTAARDNDVTGQQPLGPPDKQATAAARTGLGPAATAALTVVVALAVLAAAVTAFVAHRRRRGVLRRAHSRQPIFSAAGGGSIDMQDSLWNPVFGGGGGGGGGGGSETVDERCNDA